MTSGTTQGPQYWAKVLHNAVQVPPTSPRYAESRQVASYAVQQIDALHGAQNAADSTAAAPGKSMGGVQSLMNGIGLGVADAVSPDALQYAQLASKANPTSMAVAGGIGRTFSTGAAAVANPILGFGAAAGIQGMTADPELTMGAVPRMIAGGVAGGGAAMLGAGEVVGSKIAGMILRRFVPTFLPAANRIAQQFTGLLKGKIPAADIDALAEGQIRAAAKKANPSFSEQQLDQVMGAWRKYNAKVPKGPEVATSPGTTVTQVDDPLAEPTYMRRGGRSMRPGQAVRPEPENVASPASAGKSQVAPKLTGGHWIDENTGAPLPFTKDATVADVQAFYQQRGQLATPTNGGKQVANSYKELQALIRQGIPEGDIKINYYTRGGKLQETVPPKPSSNPLANTNSFFKKSTDELRAMLTGPTAPSTPWEMRPKIREEILRRMGH